MNLFKKLKNKLEHKTEYKNIQFYYIFYVDIKNKLTTFKFSIDQIKEVLYHETPLYDVNLLNVTIRIGTEHFSKLREIVWEILPEIDKSVSIIDNLIEKEPTLLSNNSFMKETIRNIIKLYIKKRNTSMKDDVIYKIIRSIIYICYYDDDMNKRISSLECILDILTTMSDENKTFIWTKFNALQKV